MIYKFSSSIEKKTHDMPLPIPSIDGVLPIGQPILAATGNASKMTIRIPLTTFPDEVGNASVLTLVNKFGHQTMTIYNAILSEKRIFFLGFDRPAGDLSTFVLAAIRLVCPPFTGLIANSFPYTNLCYLDFLTVPGFIAGVSNPVFEERGEWWDVLCNIQTGRVTVNPKLAGVFPDPALAELDADLMNEVEFYKSSHFGDDKILSLFQRYTQRLADYALGSTAGLITSTVTSSSSSSLTSSLSSPSSAAGSAAAAVVGSVSGIGQGKASVQQARVRAWKATALYHRYTEEQKQRAKASSFEAPGAIIEGIFKLKTLRNLSDETVTKILQTFVSQVKTEVQVIEFLSYLPEADGGLFPIAVGLFHSSETIRKLSKIGRAHV